MGKSQWTVSSIPDLHDAFASWPGEPYEKGVLLALLLRVEIEQLAARLPPSVVLAGKDKGNVHRRLMLSVGAPDLDAQGQRRRLRAVRAASAAYQAICDVLHGRNPDQYPPASEVSAWTEAVDMLRDEFAGYRQPDS